MSKREWHSFTFVKGDGRLQEWHLTAFCLLLKRLIYLSELILDTNQVDYPCKIKYLILHSLNQPFSEVSNGAGCSIPKFPKLRKTRCKNSTLYLSFSLNSLIQSKGRNLSKLNTHQSVNIIGNLKIDDEFLV